MAYDDSFYFGQCKIIVDVLETDGSAKTITVSNGTRNWSAAVAEGKGVVMVPGRDRYSVALVDGTGIIDSEMIDVGYGDCAHLELGVPHTATTFSDIKKILKAGKEGEYLAVGDTIACTLTSGEELDYEIAAIDLYTDQYAHSVIMRPKWLLNELKTRGSNIAWPGSTLNTWLNESFFALLPQDAKDVAVVRQYEWRNYSAQGTLMNEKIFLPTDYEVFGVSSNTTKEQEVYKQWPLYTNAAKRSMTKGKSGAAQMYATMSLNRGNANYVAAVGANGTVEASVATGNQAGVCPCFMIGV